MIERLFKLSENETSAGTELLVGGTTFLTMAYIIFVQPAVLSRKMFGLNTGMDFGAITTGTCLSAALATAIMASMRAILSHKRPAWVKFFFVFSAIPAATAAGFANSWQVALGVVFVSGVIF
jgi:AGZA family xanthine/uracil permease-like MFS transporter